jgi:hypothetical protein
MLDEPRERPAAAVGAGRSVKGAATQRGWPVNLRYALP